MTTGVVSAPAKGVVGEVREALAARTFEILPVLDDRGDLLGAVPLAELRVAPATAPISQLVQHVETILADVPLARRSFAWARRACASWWCSTSEQPLAWWES